MIPIGTVMAGVNALSGLLNPLAKAALPEEASEPASAGSLSVPKPQLEPPPGATAALRQILARYDVTQISPRQFSQMLQELRKTGALPKGI